jgi:hypothetical protein
MTTYTDTENLIRFERIRLAYNQFQQRVSGRAKTIFLVAVIVASTGLISPPLALIGGLIYGLTLAHPCQADVCNWRSSCCRHLPYCLVLYEPWPGDEGWKRRFSVHCDRHFVDFDLWGGLVADS